MIKKNPFVKMLIRDQKSDIFHTSAYAKAQSGSSFGAASSESFAARQKIDQNRQNIRKYNDSRVAAQRFDNAPRPKEYTPPENSFGPNALANSGAASGAVSGVSARPTSGFTSGTSVRPTPGVTPGAASSASARPTPPRPSTPNFTPPNIRPKF